MLTNLSTKSRRELIQELRRCNDNFGRILQNVLQQIRTQSLACVERNEDHEILDLQRKADRITQIQDANSFISTFMHSDLEISRAYIEMIYYLLQPSESPYAVEFPKHELAQQCSVVDQLIANATVVS